MEIELYADDGDVVGLAITGYQVNSGGRSLRNDLLKEILEQILINQFSEEECSRKTIRSGTY